MPSGTDGGVLCPNLTRIFRETRMSDLEYLYMTLKVLFEHDVSFKSGIPLFSFEGLPGAGKTTQAHMVADLLNDENIIAHFIELPTDSSVGKLLRGLYSNVERWEDIRHKTPWVNPVFLSVDLKMAIDKAVSQNARCALMSRGILSTYYYNIDAYGNNIDYAWREMANHMRAFYRPTAIFFIDVPEEEANNRVIKRNREPLRKMDDVSQMRIDKEKLFNYIKKIDMPVHIISGTGNPDDISKTILKKIKSYLGVK